MKKVTTERAPVAGLGRNAGSGRSAAYTRSLFEAASEPSRPTSGNRLMEHLMRSQGRAPFGTADTQTPSGGANVGAGAAAAAAGVLTAVDEDGEGDEEAQTPAEFEYFSDGGPSDGPSDD